MLNHNGFQLHHYNGIIKTFTQEDVDLKNPIPETISLIDIAKSLSNISHWNGHTILPFTVAQHSVMVSCMAPEPLKKMALMHDAAEAYTGDIVKPLKMLLGANLLEIEHKLMVAICQKFNLELNDLFNIKQYDNAVVEMEFEYFFKKNPAPLVNFLKEHQSPVSADVWSHQAAEFMFLSEFNTLFGGISHSEINQPTYDSI